MMMKNIQNVYKHLPKAKPFLNKLYAQPNATP